MAQKGRPWNSRAQNVAETRCHRGFHTSSKLRNTISGMSESIEKAEIKALKLSVMTTTNKDH